jgi:N-acyl-D-amino-acid deacylase
MLMPQFDLVVRGGTLVDGTGSDPFVADVAIADGRIVEVGRVRGSAREELDARDRLVTPGFVDIHTHYDGQVTWEQTLAPSSVHGVTTAVMGNCGVGFAPCRPEHHELLIRVMEGVEDIPGIVMAEGIPWNWETFPDYLDALAARRADIDFAAQVPHAPIRVYVMGTRGAAREPATASDIERMAELVRGGVAAGGLGFSTSRTLLHRTKDGSLTPTATAAEEELHGIACAVGSLGTGVLQMIDDFHDAGEGPSSEFEMWRRLASASGLPVSFNLTQREGQPERWRHLVGYVAAANRDGLQMRGQVCARPIGMLFGFECSYNPFSTTPTYRAIATLPIADRVVELRKPEVRGRILAEAPGQPDPGVPVRSHYVQNMYELGDPPQYSPLPAARIRARAEALGVSPEELAYDIMLGRGGTAMLYYPTNNFADGTLDAVLDMMKSEHTVLGIADGGAHVGLICDASAPTHVLTYWTRDRAGERLPLPAAVKMLSHDTAATVGLRDRGVLKAGYKGDLNVIDYDGLTLHAPRVAYDLPAGGRRLTQTADGYVASVVSGAVTYRDGRPTGAFPGRLVRGAQPSPN